MAKHETGADGRDAYGEAFYKDVHAEVLRSARAYARHLWTVFQPASVADFGCGRGVWLQAFGELGAGELKGYDGPWNRQEGMVDPAIRFTGIELNQAARDGLGPRRYDLAISLEVVEHLAPENSNRAVATLCGLADVVMFGAAFLHQPGVRHINLQRHSFWAELFQQQGYRVYDFFRPVFWGVDQVAFWYQQNTFLYVRDSHPLGRDLEARGYAVPKRLELLDCVHPELLEYHATMGASRKLRRAVCRRIPPALRRILRCEEE